MTEKKSAPEWKERQGESLRKNLQRRKQQERQRAGLQQQAENKNLFALQKDSEPVADKEGES